ncbi:MAG: translation initiation factor IF-3 [Bdellovibrionales bacterium]|nr:translation initiation factor IF-3 [Bdellovibrionales bacterium]
MRGTKTRRGGKPERDSGYRVNREIVASEVRVINENGEMAGIMSVPQALSLAEDAGLDLIEVAAQAKPPTCKIMDYGKWKYENKKKTVAAKKKQAVISIKEIQVRPRTDEHDLQVKMKHATRFLLDGSKVKVNLRFSGREMAHQDLGLQVLEKVIKMLEPLSAVEAAPKKEGRFMFTILAPDPAKIEVYKKSDKGADDHLEDDDSELGAEA